MLFNQIAGPSVYLVASTVDSPPSLFSLTLTAHTSPRDFTQFFQQQSSKVGTLLWTWIQLKTLRLVWISFQIMTAFFTSAITPVHFRYHSCVQWSTTSVVSKNPAFAFTSLLFPQNFWPALFSIQPSYKTSLSLTFHLKGKTENSPFHLKTLKSM